MLQPPEHFLGYDLPKMSALACPVIEDLGGVTRLGFFGMGLDQVLHDAGPMCRLQPLPDDAVGIGLAGKMVFRVVDESHAAAHARAEILADRSQDHGNAAGHV